MATHPWLSHWCGSYTKQFLASRNVMSGMPCVLEYEHRETKGESPKRKRRGESTERQFLSTHGLSVWDTNSWIPYASHRPHRDVEHVTIFCRMQSCLCLVLIVNSFDYINLSVYRPRRMLGHFHKVTRGTYQLQFLTSLLRPSTKTLATARNLQPTQNLTRHKHMWETINGHVDDITQSFSYLRACASHQWWTSLD